MSSGDFRAGITGAAAARVKRVGAFGPGAEPAGWAGEVRIELPGGPDPRSVNAEQSLDDGDAGQRSGRAPPPRTGRRAPAEQHPMALVPIEPGKIEVARQIQQIQLDPVLEGLAGQPLGSRVKQHETVTEAPSQQTQPGQAVSSTNTTRTGAPVARPPAPWGEERWGAAFEAARPGLLGRALSHRLSQGRPAPAGDRLIIPRAVNRGLRTSSYIIIGIAPVCQV
jgi:hypothetical protein